MRFRPTKYIVGYNVIQALGWGASLVALAICYPRAGGECSMQDRYAAAASFARPVQLLASLEILHAVTGLVPSSPLNAFMQWLGKSNVLFMVVEALPKLHAHPVALMLLACWSLAEVIRYPWYALTALKRCPPWLTWLRYTAFIPLYPFGVGCEIVLMVTALPLLRERDMYNVHLPNPINWGFDYVWFLMGVLALYPFLWWQLYSTLLRQRRNKLAPTAGGELAARKAR